jgi:predicted nucleic acid-binding protein
MVVIDTDVLLLAFAFQRDPRQADNSAFLDQVQTAVPAITVYTLMELLGKLSFNLSAERLEQWPLWLTDA